MQACWNHTAWILRHNDTILLEASPQRPMIYVGVGQESVEMYRGNFKIEDYLSERVPLRVTGAEETDSGWTLDLEERLRIQVMLQGELAELSFEQLDPSINRFWLRVCADADESCYGCGEQMSYLNLRGRHFPLWTSEPGVGRDKTTYITWRSDVENKAGGDYYNTNYPQPTYVSSRKYYLHADCTAYADFDFRNEAFHELQFWAVPNRIRIEAADNWENLLYRLSEFLGRQPLLPDWIYNGVILGVQGGAERAFSLAERTLQSGVPLAGIWCQDWAGKRETSFGRRLQWDWKLNEKMYPGLPEKIREYKEHGIRFLAYNNGYLVNDGELYREAKEKGYFALAADGGDYLVDFGEFYCGVVDLTNPEAFEWYKDCIKKQILALGIDGWWPISVNIYPPTSNCSTAFPPCWSIITGPLFGRAAIMRRSRKAENLAKPYSLCVPGPRARKNTALCSGPGINPWISADTTALEPRSRLPSAPECAAAGSATATSADTRRCSAIGAPKSCSFAGRRWRCSPL